MSDWWQEWHLWLNTALLVLILIGQVIGLHRQQWLHDVFLPFIASIPKGIKANGKGVDW
jgi:hypothetical protein